MYFMSAMQHFFTILIRHRALRRGMMAFASEVAHLTSRRTFHNEWKGLPLIMRLINSCAIMG
ncbi:hypothetical protein B5L84_15075 [Klebsiella pneumoniae]|nr:hypothetical protein B5L84_15075 [Klebsiella pneumoniae]